jgi:hypothetical protein
VLIVFPEIMNHPDELGTTYFSPINLDKNDGDYVSIFIINNFDSSMGKSRYCNSIKL